jgi:hypothetical protein
MRALILLSLISTNCFAGGSASKETILNLLDADLANYVERLYELDEVGECTRMDSGERILPCQIEATFMKTNKRFMLDFDAYGELISYPIK